MPANVKPWAWGAAALVFAFGVAAAGVLRAGRGWGVFIAVLGPFVVWTSVEKLTSKAPVSTTGDAHYRSAMLGALLTFLGSIGLLSVGKPVPLAGKVLICAPLFVLGVLALESERRDFRRWRASTRKARRGFGDY